MVNLKSVEQLDDTVGNPESSIGSEESIPKIIASVMCLEAGYKLGQTSEYQPTGNNRTHATKLQDDVTAG